MNIRYPVILEPQEPKGFFVRFPDLSDTFTEGATEEEALFNAAEVLTAMLEWRMDNDQPLPEPSTDVVGATGYVAPDAKTRSGSSCAPIPGGQVHVRNCQGHGNFLASGQSVGKLSPLAFIETT